MLREFPELRGERFEVPDLNLEAGIYLYRIEFPKEQRLSAGKLFVR